jgi:hypothetical protein
MPLQSLGAPGDPSALRIISSTRVDYHWVRPLTVVPKPH